MYAWLETLTHIHLHLVWNIKLNRFRLSNELNLFLKYSYQQIQTFSHPAYLYHMSVADLYVHIRTVYTHSNWGQVTAYATFN